jgi:hypothetical protein
MLKEADVDLLLSRSICSGKYMVMARGEVASVEASVSAAGDFSIIGSFVIPNLHESVFAAIAAATKGEAVEALAIARGGGIVFGGVADGGCGHGGENRQLIEIRLAMALGGKAFVTGDVAAAAGAQVIGQKGMLVNTRW